MTQVLVSINWWRDNAIIVHIHNEILLSCKERRNYEICGKMNRAKSIPSEVAQARRDRFHISLSCSEFPFVVPIPLSWGTYFRISRYLLPPGFPCFHRWQHLSGSALLLAPSTLFPFVLAGIQLLGTVPGLHSKDPLVHQSTVNAFSCC